MPSETPRNRLAFLDGMRGYAARSVLLGHCRNNAGWFPVPLPDGKTAVDIFMVLSGFLMVYQWRNRHITGRDVRDFWIRRFFRIAPLYFLVLMIVFAAHGYLADGSAALQAATPGRWARGGTYDPAMIAFDAKNLLLHLTFLFGLIPRYCYSTLLGDWSISLEMQFYLIFPLLWFAVKRVGHLWFLVGIMAVASMGWRFSPHFPEPSFLPLKISVFAAGMLIAEASELFRISPARAVSVLLMAVFLMRGFPLAVPIAALLIFALIHLNDGVLRPIRWLLENRPAVFLGDASYAVYLLHPLVMYSVGRYVAPLQVAERAAVLTAVALIGSYSLGWVLHKVVEQPGIVLGRRVIQGRRQRAASVGA